MTEPTLCRCEQLPTAPQLTRLGFHGEIAGRFGTREEDESVCGTLQPVTAAPVWASFQTASDWLIRSTLHPDDVLVTWAHDDGPWRPGGNGSLLSDANAILLSMQVADDALLVAEFLQRLCTDAPLDPTLSIFIEVSRAAHRPRLLQNLTTASCLEPVDQIERNANDHADGRFAVAMLRLRCCSGRGPAAVRIRYEQPQYTRELVLYERHGMIQDLRRIAT